MKQFYNLAVCLNGHLLSDTLNSIYGIDSRCELCGKKTIIACPNCGTEMRGRKWHSEPERFPPARIPAYCRSCGEPFPWTKARIDAVQMALDEDDRCTDVEKAGLVQLLPDLMDETPKTNLAALRFQKVIDKSGEIAKNALTHFATGFGCAAFLKILGLG